MKFEWDEKKNKVNHRKHKIWFEEAQTVWADGHSIEFFDSAHAESEDRYLRVGHSSRNRPLLVVFCERMDGGIVRLISARKATSGERRQYEKGI